MSEEKEREILPNGSGIKILNVRKKADNQIEIEMSDEDALKIQAMFPECTIEEAVNHYVNLALSHYLKDEISAVVEPKLPAPEDLKTFTKSGG